MFGFLRTSEALEFAATIASDYDRLQRSVAMRQDTPEKRRTKFEKLAARIEAFSHEKKLNFYQRSKMLFAIKKGLVDKGISESEADSFLNHLLAKGLARG